MNSVRRWSASRLAPIALLLCCGLLLIGCQTQKDAALAAQQMAATSATLQAYYDGLDTLVRKTEEAQLAQSYINGVPLDDETRAQYKDSRAEIHKRVDMAATMARLSASFADIVHSTATADAAKAANDLNAELVTLKALKSNDAESEGLKVAVNAVMNVIKAHDEVKAARLMKPLAAALSTFFDSEAERYQSLADSYYVTAASNATALIDRNQVATGFLYRSSVQPFGLTAEVTDSTLRKLPTDDLKARVADRLAVHQQRDKAAVDDLSTSLHIMRDRVATVADGKVLRATLPPFTLEGVKAWANEVRSDLGEQ